MPTFISHGIIGYQLFGYKGLIAGIFPDFIGFIYYVYKLIFVHKTFDLKKQPPEWVPIDKMAKIDWLLYDISHSLILWTLIYIISGEKFILGAIFSIIMDIFLHSKDKWLGPAFLWPVSRYRFDGIHWYSKLGFFITLCIICVIHFLKTK
jgi:hypothetical protein